MTVQMELAAAQVVRRLGEVRIIALASIERPHHAEAVGNALVTAGLPSIELAAPTPAVIRAARSVDGLLVGAGNVAAPAQAEAAALAGAHFATAAGTNMEVVHACRELGLPFFPGVATPTEIERVLSLGLRHLRVFPAVMLGGIGFLQAIGPMYPEARFIPSGGIGSESLRGYLRLPSVLAVCGSGLVSGDLVRSGSFDRINWMAREAHRTLAALR
jgi:2-dehydro-3-deoxyphosphogluconate aldolase/(4S)-4-hydroxy-2-oxoglutarate aldolase